MTFIHLELHKVQMMPFNTQTKVPISFTNNNLPLQDISLKRNLTNTLIFLGKTIFTLELSQM